MKNWNISTTKKTPKDLAKDNTLYTISNGYWSLKGRLLEERGTSVPTTIINGVFDQCNMFSTIPAAKEERKYLEEDYFCEGGPSPSVANLPNPLALRVFVNKREISFSNGKITNFKRNMDMQSGVFSYQFVHESQSGQKTQINMMRYCDMSNVHLAYLRYAVTPLNYSGQISILSGIDGTVYSNVVKERQFDVTSSEERQNHHLHLSALTHQRKIAIEMDVIHKIGILENVKEYFGKQGRGLEFEKVNKNLIKSECIIETQKITETIQSEIKQGHSIIIDKQMLVSCSQDENYSYYCTQEDLIEESHENSFAANLKNSQDLWAKYWLDSDVIIEGDDLAQQYLRYSLFSLIAAAPRTSNKLSVPVKLLTGEYYQGTTFYDTDTYILPFYSYTQPEWAKNCLNWRYQGLENGRKNAQKLGLKGAKFSWQAGPAGEECLGKWWRFVHSNIHINSDVIYALMQYVEITGDLDYLYECGFEMIFESARFYCSRAKYDQESGLYSLAGVAGPDEGHCTSLDNFYTNYMASQTLLFAAQAMEYAHSLPNCFTPPVKYNKNDIKNWTQVGENLRLIYDEKSLIYEQYDGFYDLKPVSEDFFAKRRDRQEWFAPVRPYQAIHQPDVMMAMILNRQAFEPEVFEANHKFYYPKTMNFSSMSYALNAISCATIGQADEAYKNFIITAGMDIDAELTGRGDTAEGLHGTAAGGAWMAIIFGFAGIDFVENILYIKPKIPKAWSKIRFALKLVANTYDFVIDQKTIRIKCRTEIFEALDYININLNQKDYLVDKQDFTINY